MSPKFIVWDQISLHGASYEETFNIVKEYYPEISDDELDGLIQEAQAKAKRSRSGKKQKNKGR